jgi:hypothetical protein
VKVLGKGIAFGCIVEHLGLRVMGFCIDAKHFSDKFAG